MTGALGWGTAELGAAGAERLGDLYRSEAVLELERRRLFRRSWSLAASSEELTRPGDYLAVDAAGAPLVVVRDEHGGLRCFHNVCPHRGLVLLEGRGQLRRHVTCPYHQWSFALDGSLVTVPQAADQFPDLDRRSWPLRPALVTEWNGMVLVNASTAAPGWAETLSGLGERLAGAGRGPLVEVARVVEEAPCNWKLLVENHVDVYHLWYLHKESLSGFDHRRFTWESLGDNWWSLEPPKTEAPGAAALGSAEQGALGAHLVFPNLMIVTTPSYVATYDAVPLGPRRSRLTLRVRAPVGTDPGPLVEGIRSFLAEDLEACRRLQIGTGSPAFAVGPLARDHEEPVRRFHASLRQALLGEGGTRA